MSWGLISAMGHVALRTDDLQASLHDAVDVLGLRVTERASGTVYLAAGPVHHELSYVEAATPGVDALGLVARDGDALLEIRRRVAQAGLRMLPHRPMVAGVEDAFAFEGPEGFVFEITHGMSVDTPAALSFGPNRYGHFNFHPQDPTRMKDFLVELLDFRVSDVIGTDHAYFLRCNTEHHGIAIIRGGGTFHHHAWEAQSVADLTKLGDRLHALGRKLIWGPVRHGAGNNIAAYYIEHTGSVVELYTDIEHIYNDLRLPVYWDKEDIWFNNWSDYLPNGFRQIGLAPAPTVDGTV
jgi:catechol 2,3-dioxygenase-like lactoylglutathione lyase family enzyme